MFYYIFMGGVISGVCLFYLSIFTHKAGHEELWRKMEATGWVAVDKPYDDAAVSLAKAVGMNDFEDYYRHMKIVKIMKALALVAVLASIVYATFK